MIHNLLAYRIRCWKHCWITNTCFWISVRTSAIESKWSPAVVNHNKLKLDIPYGWTDISPSKLKSWYITTVKICQTQLHRPLHFYYHLMQFLKFYSVPFFICVFTKCQIASQNLNLNGQSISLAWLKYYAFPIHVFLKNWLYWGLL